MENQQIDLVLPWVNGNDPLWQAEKNRYDLTHQHLMYVLNRGIICNIFFVG